MFSLRLADGSNNGGNEVGAVVGKDGGASGLPNERIGLGGGADNTGEGGDSGSDGDGIGGGSGKGIWGGDEDHGESGDAGGEDIASSLATS
ncbi:hypothetical protein Tco_0003127 [Tanacetum coccineum]